jgi:ureidoacrylate peracid hydrolase
MPPGWTLCYQAERGTAIRKLIFTGCRTSVCVESRIRYAMFRDYSCLMLADCTAEPIGEGLPRSDRDASLLMIGCCSAGSPNQRR